MALIKLPGEKEKNINRLKKQIENMDTVKFTMNLPVKLHTEFKEKVAAERKNMKLILMEMIEKYVKS